MTFIPAAFHASIYFPGFPAPVVITLTPSSITIFASSSAFSDKSIMFTPKGLSVISFVFLISFLICSARAFAPAIIPRPPALDTAAANELSDTHAIAP